MKEIISTDKAPAAIGPYSQAIAVNGILYTSGQLPLNPNNMNIVDGGIKEQAEQVLSNLQSVLEASGTHLENVIKTTCFISDLNDFNAFNEVYSQFFHSAAPARSCVEVSRLPKDVLIEIEAIAIISK